ncbi:MAG: nucleotidyl transferase AbiEii/AbiGii toxin family protein [Planctomycetes bacterium]|nr:nucleotidyl transferase AbiEii/AbiGii toxin family protein [Planctomycetota bacterium]
MKLFAGLDAKDRKLLLAEAAARSDISTLILEKDAWVSWTLARLFEDHELGAALLFKGGTSLAKVFRVIDRFSEDVDLGVRPEVLGFEEQVLVAAASKTSRSRRHDALQAACREFVASEVKPLLERSFRERLGAAPGGSWIAFEHDERTDSPVLRFTYPTTDAAAGGSYIAQSIKLEFGSLAGQRPLVDQPIATLVDEALGLAQGDLAARVVVLDAPRTFWEKATILHAEFHRPVGRPMPDRCARHYSDFAALWHHPVGRAAAADLGMLGEVARHKAMFFPSAWASYDTAKAGSLRLMPPPPRVPALRRDYESMRPMFLEEPQSFAALLDTISDAERTLQAG